MEKRNEVLVSIVLTLLLSQRHHGGSQRVWGGGGVVLQYALLERVCLKSDAFAGLVYPTMPCMLAVLKGNRKTLYYI